MSATRPKSATEQALLAEFPEDAARIEYLFGECDRAAQEIDDATREDIRRAADGPLRAAARGLVALSVSCL